MSEATTTPEPGEQLRIAGTSDEASDAIRRLARKYREARLKWKKQGDEADRLKADLKSEMLEHDVSEFFDEGYRFWIEETDSVRFKEQKPSKD